jgi:phage terminase large subunit-like protein
MDPAGGKKLSKAKSRGRIDGAVSLVMAMAVAETYEEAPPLDIMAMIA